MERTDGRDHTPLLNVAQSTADRLNQDCFCVTLDRTEVEAGLLREAGDPAFGRFLREEHRQLFSNVSVFLSDVSLEQMRRSISAIETVTRLPEYLDAVMVWAPPIAWSDHGPAGAFMGYDFHVGEDGPKLIEINTNAGGALLNGVLAKAQKACCGASPLVGLDLADEDLGAAVLQMFEEEWLLQRGSGKPLRIAIVDEDPEAQYLYPEFKLAQALLERHGIQTVICDARQLTHGGGKLLHQGQSIDLVYNRLVDFSLSKSGSKALREAYISGSVVLTPNPHLHAKFADKRNLTLLCDAVRLAAWGAPPSDVELLTTVVPKTVLVTRENAEEIWSRRRGLFFKPVTGYGSKAVYRGAKITRTVWAEITDGSHVAQAYVPPSQRMVKFDATHELRKMDLRLYTYRGKILLTAARLYQGQATNFRTEGGGFAPVLQTSAGVPS